MGKAKTSVKRKKLRSKSLVINGVQLFEHESKAAFANHSEVKIAIAQALVEGDKEAFIDILAGYVCAHNILKVCKQTGLSRTVVYEAISTDGNPSLDTLCKIMSAFNPAA
jgi:probable addiction module antidote protein